MSANEDLEKGDTTAEAYYTFGNAKDAARVKQAIIEAGENSYGIVAIDLWIFDNQKAVLIHCGERGITWVNPLFEDQLKTKDSKDGDKTYDDFERLENIDRADHIKPAPQAPGVGIAGNYWMMEKHGKMIHPSVTETSMREGKKYNEAKPLVWREIFEFTSDPDKIPHDVERMNIIENVFGKVIGMRFDIGGYRGVTLYFARKSASIDALNISSNVTFLQFATQNIGICSAMTAVRGKIIGERQQISQSAYRRLRLTISGVSKLKQISIPEKDDTPLSHRYESRGYVCQKFYQKIVTTS